VRKPLRTTLAVCVIRNPSESLAIERITVTWPAQLHVPLRLKRPISFGFSGGTSVAMGRRAERQCAAQAARHAALPNRRIHMASKFTPAEIAAFAAKPFAEIPPEAVQDVLAYLQTNAAKGKGQGSISFKVSEKGAVSVYGLGRFPVTLYRGQWERLMSDETRKSLADFTATNSHLLAEKPVK
jgi:hypothetical protein